MSPTYFVGVTYGVLMAISTIAVRGLECQTVARNQLPVTLRKQLDRGKLVKVNAGRGDAVASSANAVVLNAGDVLAARTGDTVVPLPKPSGGGRDPASSSTDSAFLVPFTYLSLDATGRSTTYQPVYVRQGGLRYSTAERRFEGSFLIGIVDAANPGEARATGSSVGLVFGSDAVSVDPGIVLLTHTGGIRERVNVYSSVPLDSVKVDIVPDFDPSRGVPIWLPVHPAIVFESAPRSIQSFGVEIGSFLVSVRGRTLNDSVDVSLSTDNGTISPNTIRIGGAGTTIRLRSKGPRGSVKVRALAAGMEPAEIDVAYVWPIPFSIAAVVGALLGAFFASMFSINASSKTSAAKRFGGAMLGGVLGTAIYIGLGVNLIGYKISASLGDEFAVLAFAALGAMGGLTGLVLAGKGK